MYHQSANQTYRNPPHSDDGLSDTGHTSNFDATMIPNLSHYDPSLGLGQFPQGIPPRGDPTLPYQSEIDFLTARIGEMSLQRDHTEQDGAVSPGQSSLSSQAAATVGGAELPPPWTEDTLRRVLNLTSDLQARKAEMTPAQQYQLDMATLALNETIQPIVSQSQTGSVTEGSVGAPGEGTNNDATLTGDAYRQDLIHGAGGDEKPPTDAAAAVDSHHTPQPGVGGTDPGQQPEARGTDPPPQQDQGGNGPTPRQGAGADGSEGTTGAGAGSNQVHPLSTYIGPDGQMYFVRTPGGSGARGPTHSTALPDRRRSHSNVQQSQADTTYAPAFGSGNVSGIYGSGNGGFQSGGGGFRPQSTYGGGSGRGSRNFAPLHSQELEFQQHLRNARIPNLQIRADRTSYMVSGGSKSRGRSGTYGGPWPRVAAITSGGKGFPPRDSGRTLQWPRFPSLPAPPQLAVAGAEGTGDQQGTWPSDQDQGQDWAQVTGHRPTTRGPGRRMVPWEYSPGS